MADSTPRKIREDSGHICVVCKKSTTVNNRRKVDSVAGRKKKLSELLLKYGEFTIIDGTICKNCERRVLSIDKSVSEFREQCHENLDTLNIKRCRSSTVTPTKDKKRCKSKTALFKSPLPHTINSNTTVSDVSSSVAIDEFSSRDDSASVEFSPQARSPLGQIPPRSQFAFAGVSPICPARQVTSVLSPQPDIYSVLPRLLPNSSVHVDTSEDDGSFVCSTPKSAVSVKSRSHDDHGYARTIHVAHKVVKSDNGLKPPKDVSPVVGKLENLQNSLKVVEGCLSYSEVTEIQSILPLMSRNALVKCVLGQPKVKELIVSILLKDLSEEKELLKNRKNGNISYLMKKDYGDLKTFDWSDLVTEAHTEFPLLLRVLLAFALPGLNPQNQIQRLKAAIPRVGVVYAILCQTRNPRLSRVQQMVNMLLYDSICDQKVIHV
jgi:hypothetical protein